MESLASYLSSREQNAGSPELPAGPALLGKEGRQSKVYSRTVWPTGKVGSNASH